MTVGSMTHVAVAAALLAATPALAQSAQAQSQPRSGQAAGGGFASRDAVPPDAASPPPPAVNSDEGGNNWRSAPQSADAAPDAESLDAKPQPAPGTINSFAQPEAAPGFQATTGISNRNQAVSSCLAVVRARVSGGAGAARVDGIRGEWMVSGAVDDGRAFYCAIHDGAIADVQFGS